MRPTSLAIRGLKCWEDRTFELSALMAIQGPNGSGKSAIIQAIRLALLGYDPETGKQLDKTRKLISPTAVKDTLELGLSFDSGFGIRRLFGAKTETQVLPSRGESTGAACQERINEETGGLVVTLDLATFFDLSAEKRRAWLFEHLPTGAAALDWKEFCKWTDGPHSGSDEGETVLAGVVRDLWENAVQTAPNPVTGLGSAIETARREFLEADRSRHSQGEVVDRGAELLRTEEAPEPVPEGERQELEERLAVTNQRIGEARAGREAREPIEERIRTSEESHAAVALEIKSAEYILKDYQDQLESVAPVPDAVDREEERADLEAEVDRLKEVDDAAHVRRADAQAVAAVLLEQAHKIGLSGACPYALLGCDHDTDAMKEHVLEGVEAEHTLAVEALDVEEAAATIAREGLDVARSAAARVRTEIDDLERRVRTITTQRATLEQGIETKGSLLVELRERLEIHGRAWEAAMGELERLGSDDALAKLYEERETTTVSRGLLLERLDAVARYSERIAAHDREAGVLEAREKRATALRELDGNLRRLRGHVIQKMIEPLEAAGADILGRMDSGKLFRFYFERGNAATLEIGFEEDGVTRLFDAASKGERVMLTVSFIGALLSVIDPPMRLLVIDDIEQLDDDRRRALLVALVELRDRFDCVIVAGACHFYPGLPPEWDFVDLDPDDIEGAERRASMAAAELEALDVTLTGNGGGP